MRPGSPGDLPGRAGRPPVPGAPGFVTALQHGAGNRAVGRLLAGAASVQRDVGFEYETNADTYLAAAALSNAQRAQAAIPGGAAPLNKGDVLVTGLHGAHAKADLGGAGLGSNLELETDAFPETAQGRADLHRALKSIERFCALLDGLNAAGTWQVRSRDLAFAFGGTAPVSLRHVRTPGGLGIFGNPQATAAVRLDRVDDLMEQAVGGPSAGPHASVGAPPLARLELGGASAAAFQVAGDAPRLVRAGIAAYQAAAHPPLPAGFPSRELVGLCALLLSYLATGEGGAQMYPKEIAPLMARTDFGSIYTGDVPNAEQLVLTPGNGAQFVALWTHILAAAGIASGVGAQVFTQEPLAVAQFGLGISGALSRQQWLEGVSQGNDLLTAATFPVAGAQPQFQGLGGFGGLHGVADPGGAALNAPIVELRRMAHHLAPHDFTELAMGVYDLIVDVNANNPIAYARAGRAVKGPKRRQRIAYALAALL